MQRHQIEGAKVADWVCWLRLPSKPVSNQGDTMAYDYFAYPVRCSELS
jgi:hypothetical protein